MIEISDKKDCTGCWACANACMHHAITMVEDDEGFRYPEVNTETCTDCGRCESVCPIVNPIKIENHEQKAYLVQHRNERILNESTSGGGFTAIASWVIGQGGVVFGAAYNKQFEVIHQQVETIDELSLFRNSKYVQSIIGDSFGKVKQLLKEGRWVCFSGTPCQLEGLYSFLGKKVCDRLLLVDVMCHSCPSPKMFRKYLEWQKNKLGVEDFKNVLFRRKTYGYQYSTMSILTKNNQNNYHRGIDTDVMLRAFFSDMSVRPICYSCPFKKRFRCTDFTIWDCFDVEKFSKKMANDRGVTRILAHTAKGVQLLSKLKDDLEIIEIDVEKAVDGVEEMLYSVAEPKDRSLFFSDLNSMSTEDCFNKYFSITFRHRVEYIIRILSYRLGVYNAVKKMAKLVIGNRKITR